MSSSPFQLRLATEPVVYRTLEQIAREGARRALQKAIEQEVAEAVGYTLNQWHALNVFAADGAVPIDNNVSEREIKRIVLNRKNSLFVGNPRGGETAAILSSLASTCRRHGIDPQRYLTQLLTNLPDTPLSRLHTWLPDEWKRIPSESTPVQFT